MRIIDLDAAHEDAFCACLEQGTPQADEAGTRRRCWLERFRERGLRAKLALDERGEAVGMIQYLPIEDSFADGEGLYLILCIWVPGRVGDRPSFQGRGVGQALLAAAEDDARRLGAKGMAAWGLWLPVWMRASWFKRHGYRKADRRGLQVLLWKPFVAGARPPRWLPPGGALPPPVPGKVNVTAFANGWCMAANVATERARRAAADLGERVAYREIDVAEHADMVRWGRADALYVDGKEVRNGPPPSYAKIRRRIEGRLARLH